MCLQLPLFKTEKQAKNARPKIAKEDIVVYKSLSKRLRYARVVWQSPFRGMYYKRNTTYTVPELTKRRKHDRFSVYPSTDWSSGKPIRGYSSSIYKGFHAYTYNRIMCIPMIVPKGSRYYISRNGLEIVASSIKTPHRFKPV